MGEADRERFPQPSRPRGPVRDAPAHEELALASAAARGDPLAIDELRGQLRALAPPTLARLDATPAFQQEVLQRVEQALFVVEPGQRPKLEEYSGAGPLGAWLRAILLRAGMRVHREEGARARREAGYAELQPPAGDDPERRYLGQQHRTAFAAAFRRALAALPPRGRAVLQLHFVEGLTLEQIGTLYRVHRATAARWIAAARDALSDTTRRLLGERLRLEPSELDSLLAALDSQLEVSLRGLADAPRGDRRPR